MSAADYILAMICENDFSMAKERRKKNISLHLIALLPVALEVSQLFATFCGKIGELERDREQDCKKTFSDVFRSVFKRRAPLSDGES